jgi:hypothetical protein
MSSNRCIVLFAAPLLAGVWLVAACGGDDVTPLPTPGITVIGGTAAPLVTPFPTPAVTGNQLDSSAAKGYTATFPEGWSLRANFVQTRDASLDVLFEPLKTGATVQANIAVNCIVNKQESSEEHIAFETTKVARIGLNRDVVVTQRQVSGVAATVVTYSFASQNETNTPPLDKQDVLFSAGKCDWILTLATPAGQRAEYQGLFDAFLDSFRVTG